MKTKEQIIEDFQEAHVEAGGKFLRKSEVENMTVKELLEHCVPNNINITIDYIGPNR